MRERKYGVIVNIGSGSTQQFQMGVGTYAMSKYALDLFTKQLAKVEGPAGIRVNCVAPGPAPTNFGAVLREGQPADVAEDAEKMRAAIMGEFPLGRFGTAQDIANATVFLASDVTSYVTGQVFTCPAAPSCKGADVGKYDEYVHHAPHLRLTVKADGTAVFDGLMITHQHSGTLHHRAPVRPQALQGRQPLAIPQLPRSPGVVRRQP